MREVTKVTIGGKQHPASALNFRVIGRLMRSGVWKKLAESPTLPEHEQLDVMVAVIAACTGLDVEWILDNGLPSELAGLPAAFGKITAVSTPEGASVPNAESP